MIAFSASRVFGAWSDIAATAFAGSRLIVIWGPFRSSAWCGRRRARTRPGMAAVSGMLCQYFFGICARIAFRLVRAGLNVLS